MKLELKRRVEARIKTWFRFQTFVILVTLLWLMGQLSFLGWPGDLASHFQMQYIVLSFIGIAFALQKQAWKFLPSLLVVFGFSLSALLPYWPNAQSIAANTLQPHLRLMQANVLLKNHDYSRVRQAIEQVDPDILSLQEVDAAWLSKIQPVLDRYPYHVQYVKPGRFLGIALYSKLPFQKAEIRYYGGTKRPNIVAEIRYNQQNVILAAMHPYSPGKLKRYERRNAQFMDFAKYHPQATNLIVIGDLNNTPFSTTFKQFLTITGLKDTRIGKGIYPTWPVWLPLIAIPIDHVLVSPQFEVQSFQTGPYVGSDHLPVIVDLALKKPAEASTAEPLPQAHPSPAKAADLL